MGKDLKGKELGDGLSQKKDGRYCARFTEKTGLIKGDIKIGLAIQRQYIQKSYLN